MKAAVMTSPGEADVLELRDIDKPRITQSTQLLVRLKAAGVNPVDTKLRRRGTYYPERLPAVLGCDGAGVVEAVGDSVRNYRVGDAVYFCNGGIGGEPGNYAEYTVVDESHVAPKPASLSFVEAAAAPLVLITAYEALFDRATVQKDQHVLIHAGAGGVGHIAIQLAKTAATRVATTVSSQDKAAFVTRLGADLPILYRETDFISACSDWTAGAGVDMALDTVGGAVFGATVPALRHYGHLVTLLEPAADMSWKEARLRNLTVSYELMLTPMLHDLQPARRHQANILAHGAQLFDSGQLRIQVADVFPLGEAARAHQLVEKGSMTGKAVLRIADE